MADPRNDRPAGEGRPNAGKPAAGQQNSGKPSFGKPGGSGKSGFAGKPNRAGKPGPFPPKKSFAQRGPAANAKPAAPPAKPVSPARRAAFDILLKVELGQGNSDDLLHGEATRRLSEQDRNLATALVMGCLRWQIALDARLRTFFDRPDQRLAEEVALALRLGALQILHMDRIPPHAALSESVELCRNAGQPHATGMVNAVLRKLLNAPAPGKKIFETPAAFAERLGHPAWLAERWVAAYGRDAALRICEAGQREPEAGVLFTETPAGLPLIDDGSRLVAELAAAARPAAATLRVWDCCAAPGGKTAVLAARLPESAAILATDVSARRLYMMRRRLTDHLQAPSSEESELPDDLPEQLLSAEVARRIRFEIIDARELPAAEGPFDLILCDVPCSGTGTLGRNPEIRLRLIPEDFARQTERQRAILTAALDRLAPGGRLIYSTCSLEPEECEQVVATVVGSRQGVNRIPAETALSAIPGLEQAMLTGAVTHGTLRTLPGTHPGDGFYAAILERVAH